MSSCCSGWNRCTTLAYISSHMQCSVCKLGLFLPSKNKKFRIGLENYDRTPWSPWSEILATLMIWGQRTAKWRARTVRALSEKITYVPYVRSHLDGYPAPSPKGHSPQFSAHVCSGETAGWIKIPLGTDVSRPRPVCLMGTQQGSKRLWMKTWRSDAEPNTRNLACSCSSEV